MNPQHPQAPESERQWTIEVCPKCDRQVEADDNGCCATCGTWLGDDNCAETVRVKVCPVSKAGEGREPLTMLLREAMDEYADHQSWRCDHPDRYSHDPDCPCGLVKFTERVEAALATGDGPEQEATQSNTEEAPDA